MPVEIVGLVGVKGSGKTFQRDRLVKKRYVPIDFKDALVEMCEDILGFPIKDHYEEFKLCVVGLTRPEFRGKLKHPLTGKKVTPVALSAYLLTKYPGLLTGRQMLRNVGTETMRKRDPDYWVKAYKDKAVSVLKKGKGVVTADVRFRNEMAAVDNLALVAGVPYRIVFCNYKSPRYDAKDKHASELMAQEYLAKGLPDLFVIQKGTVVG